MAKHYIRNWPEGIFIFLVMELPFVVAVILPSATFLAFLARLALGMFARAIAWVGVVVGAGTLYDRCKD